MNIKLPINKDTEYSFANNYYMKTIPLFVCLLFITNILFAQWTTSGTNIYNSNTGFVGIGTTSPAFPLDVNGVVNSSNYMSATGGFYTNSTRDGFNSSLGTNFLGFRTNNIDNRMVIDLNGKVGIGTTSPAQNFVVSNGGAEGLEVYLGAPAGTVGLQSYNRSTSGYSNMELDAAQIALMHGNVGIGIATPANRLEVVQSNTFTNSNPATYAFDLAQNGANIGIGGYSSGSVVQSFNSLPLMLNPVGNNVIINGGGVSNVLIGETSQVNSSYRLDVNGSVRATGVTVNTTGADFVFDSTYQLTPLNKLEAYIRACHHLPGVATAAQMQKDGTDLGDLTTKLLQKVEELTLYSVESDKRVSEQQTLLLQLQAQLKAQQVEIDKLKAQQSAQH